MAEMSWQKKRGESEDFYIKFCPDCACIYCIESDTGMYIMSDMRESLIYSVSSTQMQEQRSYEIQVTNPIPIIPACT